MPATCSRTTSLKADAWPSVRAITWILSGSRSEIFSRRALIGAGSTFAGIKPTSRSAPTALSRYCMGVWTTTSLIAFLLYSWWPQPAAYRVFSKQTPVAHGGQPSSVSAAVLGQRGAPLRPSPGMPHDQKPIQQPERNRRDDEQVQRCDGTGMIGVERFATLIS